ncbi:hypothetical protein MNBD_BACTEROID07-1710 [hydrothermal vent metagenome]|uniref:DUF2975 domain-containing protein n=1 Tax=hydrothermal vent metagenome TaxID=652676 RepID=A0A3B0UPE3_9ZZZZ
METKKAPLSIRIIYWVTNISFWLSVLASFLLLVDGILIYANQKADPGFEGRFLPVVIQLQNTGHLNLSNQSTTLKLTTYTIGIEVNNPPRFIVKKIILLNLLLYVIGAYILWIFRMFVKNVKKGEIFSIKNISLLKKISYILISSWLLGVVYSQFTLYIITNHFKFTHVQMMGNLPDYLLNMNPNKLWMALFLWVLAHIFITGLKLQQEKDLTI